MEVKHLDDYWAAYCKRLLKYFGKHSVVGERIETTLMSVRQVWSFIREPISLIGINLIHTPTAHYLTCCISVV